jgi:uroporphyrinogen-III synthase
MAIGATTAEAARTLGFTVNLTLNEPTPSELTRELMQWATTTT